MNLGFELSTTAAKPKRQSDDAPTQVPMRGEGGVRRKPSADQKKVRRQMARSRKTAGNYDRPEAFVCAFCYPDGYAEGYQAAFGTDSEAELMAHLVEAHGYDTTKHEFTSSSTATKESSMSRQREVEILQAMAKADLPEQRRLAQELEDLRASRTASLQADRDLDLASTVIRDTLTPVAVHERHTAATDWITELPTVVEGSFDNEMRTQATLWFNNLHEAVKADREEFAEQAQGMARREAGRYGEAAPAAAQTFLDHVAHLHRVASDQNGQGESSVSDYDTKADQDPLFAEDWEGHDPTAVHPPMPGAGESTGADYHSNGSSLTPDDWEDSRRAASLQTEAEHRCPACEGSGVFGDALCHVCKGSGSVDKTSALQTEAGPYDSGSFKKCSKCGGNNYANAGTCAHCGARLKRTEDTEHGYKASRTAAEGQTCSTCGDKIAKDPASENPSTWHHDNGEKHDHEAKPSKEATRHTAGPKHGDKDVCHADGQPIEFFDGQWYHLSGGPSHNDVYPATPREKAEKQSARTAAGDWKVGDVLERDGKRYQITRITPAGAAGTSVNDGPTYHATIMRDGEVNKGGYTADIWSKSQSNPTSAFTKVSARKTAVSLTNVGIEGEHGVGTDPNGNRVKFRLSEKDKADLKAVLYSDLAVNFSGVDVDESDLIKEGSLQATASRPIHQIADEIVKEWGVGNINYAARPYLDAMRYLDDIHGSFGEDPAYLVVSYFLSNSRSFQGEKAKALKAELREMVQNRKKSASVEAGGRRGNDFSISDAKNEDGEWIMSPEQIRAEMGVSEPDPDDYDDYYDEDERYASRRQASDNPNGPKNQDGGADSSLENVEVGDEGDKPMWPWELAEGDPATGQGAANVSSVPTPGGESGYPQPKKSSLDLPIPAQARLADFRSRVQSGLTRMAEVEKTAAEGWVDLARRVVENKQHEGGLDLFSASAMLQVHDALSGENQAKFAAMPLMQAHEMAFRLIDKTSR